MDTRVFIDGFQGSVISWFLGTKKTLRVLFLNEDGEPEDTDGASALELVVYSNNNRTTVVDTLTLTADTGNKGHATYDLVPGYVTLSQNTTYFIWGRIDRNGAGDVAISKVGSTLSVA